MKVMGSHGEVVDTNIKIDTHLQLNRTKRIITKVYVNIFYNKIILIFIIVIEVCILGVLIYRKINK